MNDARFNRRLQRRLIASLAASAGLLLLTWFAPEVVTPAVVFPWDRLPLAGPWGIAAVLAPPACGALLLLALLLPIPFRARALAGRLVGPVAIILPLLGAIPAVPVPGWVVAVAAVAGAAVAAWLLARSHDLWGHIAVGALPVAMLSLWLVGLLRGEPAGFLAGIKAPIVLYAGMLATAVSAATLLAGAATPRADGQ
jgi:hypothetical protein